MSKKTDHRQIAGMYARDVNAVSERLKTAAGACEVLGFDKLGAYIRQEAERAANQTNKLYAMYLSLAAGKRSKRSTDRGAS